MAETIPSLLQETVDAHPDVAVQIYRKADESYESRTYAEFLHATKLFASGLLAAGISRGDRIGFICDNRYEWLACDIAILSIGAIDVPRGCDSSSNEISYILRTVECRIVIVENDEQLGRIIGIIDDLPSLEQVVVIDRDDSISIPSGTQIRVSSYDDIMRGGATYLEEHPNRIDDEIALGKRDDTATIIFTSGTTGEPKGVMLSHENFLHQIRGIPDVISARPSEINLSVLPIWHSFERIMEYVIISLACTIAYSKPVGKVMLADFEALRPQWMAAVPRVWEGIQSGVCAKFKSKGAVANGMFKFFVSVGTAKTTAWSKVRGRRASLKKSRRWAEMLLGIGPALLVTPIHFLGSILIFGKIKKRLGGRFIAGITAGGSFPPSVSAFYSAIDILILNGYGLTEAAPLLTFQNQHRPVYGSVGRPISGTQIKIVGEQNRELAPGATGLIFARGPQIMQGYYREPEQTSKVLSLDGWLDTGDLGALTNKGDLIISGRAKDTIVLSNGENVEPVPIEEALKQSPYIEQAVVLGQDRKYIAALIIPDREAIEEFAGEQGIEYSAGMDYRDIPEIEKLISDEVKTRVSGRNGFKIFERVNRFELLSSSFEVERELSHKLEVKRHAIVEIYKSDIEKLYS